MQYVSDFEYITKLCAMKILLSSLCFLIFTNSFSQDAELLDKNWFLYSMTIDQVDYPLPISSFPNELNATAKISFSETMFMLTEIPCGDGYESEVAYAASNIFSNTVAGTALIGLCGGYSLPILNLYTQHYAIYGLDVQSPNNPFSYIISNDGHSLEITNPAGDKAFYGDTQLLSSKSFSKNSFAIAPNPVKDILNFSGIDQDENTSINIYDVFGKRVLNNESIDWDKNALDVSNLDRGIYFLKVLQKDGSIINRKFVKK